MAGDLTAAAMGESRPPLLGPQGEDDHYGGYEMLLSERNIHPRERRPIVL